MAVSACALRISLAFSLDRILLTLFSVGLSFFFLLPVTLVMMVLQVTAHRFQNRQLRKMTKRMTPTQSAMDSAREKPGSGS